MPQQDDPRPLAGPLLIELGQTEAADPALAAPLPEALEPGRAVAVAAALGQGRVSVLGRAARWIFGALAGLVLSVAAWDFGANLLARNAWLGGAAVVLAGLALGLLALLAGREALAFARIARIDRLRAAAGRARSTADIKAARAVVARLAALYAGRAECAWGRARLAEREGEVFDADALLSLAEAELLAPLDRAALAEVEAAARQVATVTAFVPLALADVATALYANLRLIRRLSEIYGGRSGMLGSWQLMRRVFAAVIGAGAVALADDLIGSVAGGGVLARLSRRFGEGVMNGALTARTGITAMELCRPLPFVAQPRPGTSATLTRALSGLVVRNGRGEGPGAE